MEVTRIKLGKEMNIVEYFHDLFIACPFVWYCLNLVPDQGAKPIPQVMENRRTVNYL